jgi:predicted transcriptional regulator
MNRSLRNTRIKYGSGTYVSARLTHPEKSALVAIAAEERRTLSQIARFAIQEFLQRREPKPKAGKA